MNKKILVLFAVLGLFVLVTGCVEEKKSVAVEKGTTEILVGDVPIDTFKHVNVTFSEIKLYKQTDDENESPWRVVTSTPKTVDLIYLHLNNLNESLGIADIEVGNYSKLWIHVDKVVGVLNSTNETVNITVPSGWLKIQQLHLFNITKGNNTITVDIDLEGSIHTFHGGEEYKFIPVISSFEYKHEKKLKFREHNKSKIKNMAGNHVPAIDIVVDNTVVKNKITLDADVNYTFNASGTLDVDGDNLTYLWDFGDGTNATGAVVTHSFSDSNKPYTVILTVSDGVDIVSETFKVQINKQSSGQHGQGQG